MDLCVEVSPQFDLCYGLAGVVAQPKRPDWITSPEGRPWFEGARLLGSAFWLALPDVLGARPPAATVDDFLKALADVPGATAHARLIRGLFHDDDPANPSPRKREWLEFIGLEAGREPPRTSEALHKEGGMLLRGAIEILDQFRVDFEPAWEARAESLRRSRDQVAALVRTHDLASLVKALNLAVEVDTGRKRLRALRGGYEIGFSDIRTVYLLPSFVNIERFWTVADETRPATAFFPYLAPGLNAGAERAIDPWLVCRALGDPTRAAIMRLLAARPMTSADLMRELGLSKANVSHHVFQLREAMLVEERAEGRAVRLSARRKTMDGLSAAFRAALPRPAGRRSETR